MGLDLGGMKGEGGTAASLPSFSNPPKLLGDIFFNENHTFPAFFSSPTASQKPRKQRCELGCLMGFLSPLHALSARFSYSPNSLQTTEKIIKVQHVFPQ